MIYIITPIAKPPNKTVKTRKYPYQPKKLAEKNKLKKLVEENLASSKAVCDKKPGELFIAYRFS